MDVVVGGLGGEVVGGYTPASLLFYRTCRAEKLSISERELQDGQFNLRQRSVVPVSFKRAERETTICGMRLALPLARLSQRTNSGSLCSKLAFSSVFPLVLHDLLKYTIFPYLFSGRCPAVQFPSHAFKLLFVVFVKWSLKFFFVQ